MSLAHAREVSVCATRSHFIHLLSLCSCGNATSFPFMSYIIVLAKLYDVTCLNNFYFVSFFYYLFICQHQRKIRLLTLSKSYLYKLLLKFLFSLLSIFLLYLSLLWAQIKHSKLFLKHNVWHEKKTHCIAYNNIWIWVIIWLIIV